MKNFNQPLSHNPFAAKFGKPEDPKTPGIQPELDPKKQTRRWEKLTKGELARLASLGADNLRFAPVHLDHDAGGKSLDTIRVGLIGTDPAKAKEAYVHLWFNEDKKGESKLEFIIKSDGSVQGRIPTSLNGKITHAGVMREVLEQFESLNPESWYEIDDQIAPPGQGGPIGPSKKPTERQRTPDFVDPRRIAFYEQQADAILRINSPENGGFRGYQAVFFPGFAVLDCRLTNNAAYIIDGTPERFELPLGATREEVNELLKKLPIYEWLTRSKPELQTELRRKGEKKFQHKGDEWETRLQAEIDKRLKKNN